MGQRQKVEFLPAFPQSLARQSAAAESDHGLILLMIQLLDLVGWFGGIRIMELDKGRDTRIPVGDHGDGRAQQQSSHHNQPQDIDGPAAGNEQHAGAGHENQGSTPKVDLRRDQPHRQRNHGEREDKTAQEILPAVAEPGAPGREGDHGGDLGQLRGLPRETTESRNRHPDPAAGSADPDAKRRNKTAGQQQQGNPKDRARPALEPVIVSNREETGGGQSKDQPDGLAAHPEHRIVLCFQTIRARAEQRHKSQGRQQEKADDQNIGTAAAHVRRRIGGWGWWKGVRDKGQRLTVILSTCPIWRREGSLIPLARITSLGEMP